MTHKKSRESARPQSHELLWEEFPSEGERFDTETRPNDVVPRPPPAPMGRPLGTLDPAGYEESYDDIEMLSDSMELDELPESLDSADMELIEDAFPRRIYVREAEHLRRDQPERAALMWANAALQAEWELAGDDVVLGDLQHALDLRPDSPWLLPLSRHALRRMRHHTAVVKVGQQEVRLGGDPARRAAILTELASIQRYIQDDTEGAINRVITAERLHPSYVAALTTQVALQTEFGAHEQAADTLVRLSEVLATPSERALYLYTAGTLHETTLNNPGAAEEAYTRAIEADPQHIPAAMALAHLYDGQRQWKKLCTALERLAELVPDRANKMRLLVESGSIHLERTGDVNAAARDLHRASVVDTSDARALARLAYAYEASGRTRELVETLELQLELTTDDSSRAALWTRMGHVLATYLDDIEGALVAHHKALEALPGFQAPMEALAALYRRSKDRVNLLAILARLVESTLPDSVRASLALEMGEVLTELNRPEEAVVALRRALSIRPDFKLALWGLRNALRQLGRYGDLADLVRTEIASTRDPKSRTDLALELSRLLSGPLDDPEGAIEVLRHTPPGAVGRSVARELISLCEANGRYADLVELMLGQADDTTDDAEARAWMLKAAALLEGRLQEPSRALEVYRSVLARDQGDTLAIHGVGRICRRQRLWNDLIALHRHQLAIDPNRTDAVAIYGEIGRIFDEQLGDQASAIVAYRQAFEAAATGPVAMPAILALERLVRTGQGWTDVIDVLSHFASASHDKRASADALCRAAEVADAQLDDLPLAASLYEDAIRIDPDPTFPTYGLLKIRRRQGDWHSAASVLANLIADSPSDEEKARLRLSLARVKEFRLGAGPDLALYAQATESSFGDKLRVELLRAHRVLGSADLPEQVRIVGRSMSDQILSAAYLLESATIAQLQEFTGSGQSDAQRAYDNNPSDPAVVWCLDRALWHQEQWQQLAELRETTARSERDPTIRVVLLAGAVQAFLEADNAQDAARTAHQCLGLDPRNIPALIALATIAEVNENWTELAELCDRSADACDRQENKLEFYLRAADLWSHEVGDPARALQSLAFALRENPNHETAFRLADEQLRAQGNFSELSRLYGRRIKASKDPIAKVDLLRAHAVLLRTELGDMAGATAELAQLLTLAPRDAAALTDLVDLLLMQKRWADAAKTLTQLVATTTDPVARHEARLTQAELRIDRLHEPDRARAVLEEALADYPGDPAAAKMMVKLTRTVGDWEDAKRQLNAFIATSTQPADTTWAMLELADVARLGLWDNDLAGCSELDAVETAASDPSAVEILFEDFRSRGELPRLVDIGTQVLSAQPNGGGTALRRKIASVVIDVLGDAGKAQELAEGILAQSSDDLEARLLLGRALELGGSHRAAAKEFKTVILAGPQWAPAYAGAARTYRALGKGYIAASAESMLRQVDSSAPAPPELPTPDPNSPPRLKVNQLPLPEEIQGLQTVMELIAPHLAEVFPAQLGGESVLATDPAAIEANKIADIIGIDEVFVTFGDTKSVRVSVGHPTIVLLPAELRNAPTSAAFRYWVGHALALAAGAGALVTTVSPAQLDRVLAAVWASWRVSDPAVKELRQKVQNALDRNTKKILKQLEQPASSEKHWNTYHRAERHRADLIGVVLSRDPGGALAAIARSQNKDWVSALRERRNNKLLKFALSDSYTKLATQLWG